MVKRGSRTAHLNRSTVDDVSWVRSFKYPEDADSAIAHTDNTGTRGKQPVLGFMPGLWRTVNDKGAFASVVAAASASGHCSGDSNQTSRSTPASYHPET
jgi:hypothetical protein